MDTSRFFDGPCPIGRGLALVNDAWSMMILRDAGMGGVTRFEGFRASLGMAPNILAARLKALTAAGLLERRRYSDHPPRDEYLLTDAGRDFLPILQAIAAWGRKHNGAGELSYSVDAESGEPVEAVVVDRRTGAPLGERPLRLIQPGETRSS